MKSVYSLILILLFIVYSNNALAGIIEKSRALVENTEGQVVAGQNDWLYLKEEFSHIAAGTFWGEQAKAVSRV